MVLKMTIKNGEYTFLERGYISKHKEELLAIPFKPTIFWTKEEDEILVGCYNNGIKPKAIYRILRFHKFNRTVKAITARARLLGVQPKYNLKTKKCVCPVCGKVEYKQDRMNVKQECKKCLMKLKELRKMKKNPVVYMAKQCRGEQKRLEWLKSMDMTYNCKNAHRYYVKHKEEIDRKNREYYHLHREQVNAKHRDIV